MNQNDLHGFKVLSRQEIKEQECTLIEMEYVQNGAKLIWCQNEETNRCFSIAFKTIPHDDTGVFHILEHSVLGGSQNYPVKDPFLYCLKSSMNTFLNAMTFPDKTLYPISSRNEKDFMNLVHVYLDAVFRPTIYDHPYTFLQEGWHYAWEDENLEPTLQGVVLNEMKGAFTSVDMQLDRLLRQNLFRDTCYQYEAGGDPERIPNLSYETFLTMHQEYYHPSNAYIYVDGKVDLDALLTLLDEEYLAAYPKQGHPHEIPYQEPLPARTTKAYYALGKEEDKANQTQVAFGKIVCDFTNREKLLALVVLSNYLTGTNEAPLKHALLLSGLAQDAYCVVSDSIQQPYAYLKICNTDDANLDAMQKLIQTTLHTLINQGFDKDALSAEIDQLEFQLKESSEPQGLGRNMAVLNAWLYGGKPSLYLDNESVVTMLRASLQTNYYEDLAKEVFLDEKHLMTAILLPSYTKQQEIDKFEHDRIQQSLLQCSLGEKEYLRTLQYELKQWQNTPDTVEAMASLPVLKRKDIQEDGKSLSTKEIQIKGVPVLFHAKATKGIFYANLYFSLADVDAKRIREISFMTNLIGMLPTKKHSVSQLQLAMKQSIGFIDYNVVAFSVPHQVQACKPAFVVSLSVLENKLSDAIDWLVEVLCDTDYEAIISQDAIYDILVQGEENIRMDILENGHRYASGRASAHFLAKDSFKEQTEGFAFYKWLKDFREHYEERIQDFVGFATQMQEMLFNAKRMIISIANDEIPQALPLLIDKLDKPGKKCINPIRSYALNPNPKELIRIPAGISYAACVSHLECSQHPYTGALRTLQTIVSYDYLWNEVRVKNGAYGCGLETNANGRCCFYSYRDPNPKASLAIFKKTANYIQAFCTGDNDLESYCISALASSEPLLSVREALNDADTDYFSGITLEDRKRIHDEILYSTQEDLLSYSPAFKQMAHDSAYCIVGDVEVDDDWKIYDL